MDNTEHKFCHGGLKIVVETERTDSITARPEIREDFQAVFARLRSILRRFEPQLVVKANEPGNYYLDVPLPEGSKKELFFGAVQIKKNYASYHLMPVYARPDLLVGISPRLKKRMQGKACFNFTSVDEEIIGELAALTNRGFEGFKKEWMR